jgi:hypothetical protein
MHATEHKLEAKMDANKASQEEMMAKMDDNKEEMMITRAETMLVLTNMEAAMRSGQEEKNCDKLHPVRTERDDQDTGGDEGLLGSDTRLFGGEGTGSRRDKGGGGAPGSPQWSDR